MPAFAEIIEEVRPVAGSICSVGVEGNPNDLFPWTPSVHPARPSLWGHEHTVQLLTEDCTDRDTQGVDTAQLSALFGAGDTTTKSCQHRKLLSVVHSGRRAMEPVVHENRAKTKPLEHDEDVRHDYCRR